MKNHTRLIGSILLLMFVTSLTRANTEVSFQDSFNARSTPNFDARDTGNAVGTVSPSDRGILIGTVDTDFKNFGIHVLLTTGPNKGKAVWIYHHKRNSNITLMKNGQRVDPNGEPMTKAAIVNTPPRIQSGPTADSYVQRNEELTTNKPCTTCKTQSSRPTSPESIQQVKEAITSVYPSAFKGALKTMAVLYQSCSVLDKEPYPMTSDQSIDKYLNFKKYFSSLGHGYNVRTLPPRNLSKLVDTHYYLKDLKGPENNQCQDMRQRPPLYTYGGKPKTSKTEINLLVPQKTSGASFSGLDCSTFVSTALTASGLRIKPGQPILQNYATSTQLSKFTEKNSCFTQPAFTADNSLKSGDIIAYSGHTFMIDTVGKDPFGFENMQASGIRLNSVSDCKQLPIDTTKFFDFRLIQSAGDGSLAVSRTEASVYLKRSKIAGRMRDIVVNACIAKVTGNKVQQTRGRTTILRHRGGEVPGCLMPKDQIPQMTGESCVAACI